MGFFEELQWRGLVFDSTRDTEAYLKDISGKTAYIGFDPTARSLHIGSLLPIMVLVHWQRHGGKPIAVVGGGTGMIGDPSGKTEERKFLSDEELTTNQAGMRKQLEHFLDFEGKNAAIMPNNIDWLGKIGYMEFLRDIGKYYTVNQMLAKESVKIRLDRAKEGAEGISYTEFSYMLMQAYDYLHLFDAHACRMQMGGSDQWGNITAGIELIGRLRNEQAYGLVMPLIMSASGKKFGKSEEGNVWLDADMTSPYRFYQYWINTVDDDVEKYLKYFTLLEQTCIAEIVKSHTAEPHLRIGQKALAEDITRRVHGDDGLKRARAATEALFGGDLDELSAVDLADVFADVPSVNLAEVPEATDSFTAIELATWSGMAKSRGEARRLIDGGGVYINNRPVTDQSAVIDKSQRLHDQYLVLRKGKKSYYLVVWK